MIDMIGENTVESERVRKKREYTQLGLIKNPLTKYLNIGGRVDGFLTEDEEISLVNEYRHCIKMLEENLNCDEATKLSSEADEARQELFISYRFLVAGRVRSAEINLMEFKQSKLDLDDLLQEGSLGLIKVVDKHLKNPDRRLYVKAKERIKWEVYDAIIASIRNGIPDNTYFLLRKMDKAGKLTAEELVKNSKKPGHAHLNIEEAKNVIMLYKSRNKKTFYYDDTRGQDADEDLSNFTNERDNLSQKNETREIVLNNFRNLSKQQRLYIAMKLGVGKILNPIPRKKLMRITGLTSKEVWTSAKKQRRRCRLSLKENTLCGIVNGNLNGRLYTQDEIKDILNVDDNWIKIGESGIKKLVDNPILNELR